MKTLQQRIIENERRNSNNVFFMNASDIERIGAKKGDLIYVPVRVVDIDDEDEAICKSMHDNGDFLAVCITNQELKQALNI